MLQLSQDCKPCSPGCFRTLFLMLCSGRPLSSMIAGSLSLSVVWIHDGISARGVLVGLAMTVVTMFGFVVNDIFDYSKDSSAGVRRPIATGRLTRGNALLFSAFLLIVVAVLGGMIGSGYGVMAVAVLGLVLYTPFARLLPLLKGMYVAVLCLVPLYYATTVCDFRASLRAYSVLFLFIVGREALMDADEVAGDRQAGMTTIAVALGQTLAQRIGIVMMITATCCLVWVAQGLLGKSLAILANLTLLGILRWPDVDESRRIQLSRFPMLVAAMAVASA